MPTAKSVSQLLAEYSEAADIAGDLSDVKRQRKAAKKIHDCYKVLRESEEGRRGIMAVMSDPRPHVRSWAAAHSLQWEPENARQVLEALRNDKVFPYSIDAEMALEQFDKGLLSFDY
jgi:hypothetical protein